jgi:hypothetical protein
MSSSILVNKNLDICLKGLGRVKTQSCVSAGFNSEQHSAIEKYMSSSESEENEVYHPADEN